MTEITISEISESTTTSSINAYNKECFKCEIYNSNIKAIFDCYEHIGWIRMYDINTNTIKMISTASKREHFIEEVYRYLNKSLVNKLDLWRTGWHMKVKYIDMIHEGVRYVVCANIVINPSLIKDSSYIFGQTSGLIYDDVVYAQASKGGWVKLKYMTLGLRYQAYKDIRTYADNILKEQNKELKSRYTMRTIKLTDHEVTHNSKHYLVDADVVFQYVNDNTNGEDTSFYQLLAVEYLKVHGYIEESDNYDAVLPREGNDEIYKYIEMEVVSEGYDRLED